MFGFLKDALKVIGIVPVKVHKHPPPRCGDDGQDTLGPGGQVVKYHDKDCRGRGPELICRVIGKGSWKFCLCTHLKI